MMKRTACSALGALLLLCAAVAHAQDLSALVFMSGHWRETTEQATTEETWLGPRGDVMVATNLATRGGRTGFEFLRIVKRDGRLVYVASPEGRHPPTDFPLKELGDNQVVFENPENAFPRRIVYRRDGDVLVARIEGTLNGQPRAREWRFKRVGP